MATWTIDNHIYPKNVVILYKNELAQYVCEQEEKATIHNEIYFH